MSVRSSQDDIRNAVDLPIRISLNSNQQPKESQPPPPRAERRTPQENVNRFWKKFYAKYPGTVFTVLPENPYAQKKVAKSSKGVVQAQRAVRSYEQARQECTHDVKRIIRECRRVNQKYRDPHFDIEWDLKVRRRYCLEGLERDEDYQPKAVKRVTDIFEKPQFFIQGPTAGDVIQGHDGDCYLMAALCGLGNMKGLIDKICVIHDAAVGVYGFVFFRDGEWQQCIIDDQLYLTAPDYDESDMERKVWDTIVRRDTEEEYRRTHQTGSRALYFAKCSDPNETWLPLLEKAYAKAHGDYAAICGGWTGEAIEDLTGGVTSEIYSADILDKDEFWTNELLKVGKDFLYGCSTGQYADWLEPNRPSNRRQGIHEGHAYSIMDAVEHKIDEKTYRLVKIRNPWGNTGWSGAWSDGSAEWSPQWMERLNHKFGDDGVFWMSYQDLLKKYQRLDRTRIFGPDWCITQQWTSLHVPWSADYHQTRFSVTVTRNTPVVIVLSQLDDTYFAGLEGKYQFKLQFRVQKLDDEENYIVRSNVNYYMTRSVSTDIDLEAGSYVVLVKITATRVGGSSLDEVISSHAEYMRDKLLQVGLSYDIAHAKGVIVETDKEREEREMSQKLAAAAAREKRKDAVKARKKEQWTKNRRYEKRSDMRAKRRQQRAEEKDAKHRLRGLDGGYHSADKPLLRQNEYDSSYLGQPTAIGTGDRSFTGEFIAAYERSEGNPSPFTPAPHCAAVQGPEDPAVSSPQTPVSMHHEGSEPEAGPEAAPSPGAHSSKAHPLTPKVQINGVDAVTNVKPLKKRPAPLSREAIPKSIIDQPAAPDRHEDSREFRGHSWSDSDTESEFDWETDLDYDSEEDRPSRSRRGARLEDDESEAEGHRGGDGDGDDEAEPEHSTTDSGPEPWNAVCVVGLRVYSKDPDLSLEVVRPNPYGRSAGKPGDAVVGAGALDRDDPAKGAVAEKWAKTPMRESFDLA